MPGTSPGMTSRACDAYGGNYRKIWLKNSFVRVCCG
jgi:hypothetical protein